MAAEQTDFVPRPFEGLTGETDWVALAEVVPAATATASTTKAHGGLEVQVVTLLPGIRPAWRHPDGRVLLALQTTYKSGDRSRDLAQALLAAVEAEPGDPVTDIAVGAPGPHLQDVLDPATPFDVDVRPRFDFWQGLVIDGVEDMDAAIDQASEAIDPTAAVPETTSAYWTLQNKRPFLRWSLAVEEETLLDALARLHAARESAVMPGARYAGAFRSLGLMIPVWELPAGTEADEVTAPAAEFKARLDAALAQGGELNVLERRARAGLVARNVTIR